LTHAQSGYCEAHEHLAAPRPQRQYHTAAVHRGPGYGEWRRVRAIVLGRAGIPQDQWSRYDVDHTPAYDPDRDPDHSHYTLTPRLHADHTAKTNREDGGFGNRKRGV
jgi:hypothetical protein